MKIYFVLVLMSTFILSNDKSNFTLINKDDTKAVLLFESDDLQYEKDGKYTKINNKILKTIDKGLPELPKYTFSYGINPTKIYEVT